jgi:hypothetical protein
MSSCWRPSRTDQVPTRGAGTRGEGGGAHVLPVGGDDEEGGEEHPPDAGEQLHGCDGSMPRSFLAAIPAVRPSSSLSRWSLHPVLSRGGGRLAAARLRGGRGRWTGWICSVSFCLGAARLGGLVRPSAGFGECFFFERNTNVFH